MLLPFECLITDQQQQAHLLFPAWALHQCDYHATCSIIMRVFFQMSSWMHAPVNSYRQPTPAGTRTQPNSDRMLRGAQELVLAAVRPYIWFLSEIFWTLTSTTKHGIGCDSMRFWGARNIIFYPSACTCSARTTAINYHCLQECDMSSSITSKRCVELVLVAMLQFLSMH